MPKGNHEVRPPAGPNADHFHNFKLAMKNVLEKDLDAGEYDLTLEVVVNPGSIKDYRVVITRK
jgi:hypothetical protein